MHLHAPTPPLHDQPAPRNAILIPDLHHVSQRWAGRAHSSFVQSVPRTCGWRGGSEDGTCEGCCDSAVRVVRAVNMYVVECMKRCSQATLFKHTTYTCTYAYVQTHMDICGIQMPADARSDVGTCVWVRTACTHTCTHASITHAGWQK